MANDEIVRGLAPSEEPVQRGSSRSNPLGPMRDQPHIGIDVRNLFTLPYIELVEALSNTLFPPNIVEDYHGQKRQLYATDARIDRYILFRSAWQTDFGSRLQLALRDITVSCVSKDPAKHFVKLNDTERVTFIESLEVGSIAPEHWPIERSQAATFGVIHSGISEGLMAEPGYGGNASGLGWYYTRFMTIGRLP